MIFSRRIGKTPKAYFAKTLLGIIAAIGLTACASAERQAQQTSAYNSPAPTLTPGESESAPVFANLPATAANPALLAPATRQLLGMTPGHVAALLGRPKLIRSEPPAQVWLYRNASCVFHIYLYRESSLGGYSVSHIAAVSLHGQRAAVDRCFSETLSSARRNPQSS